VYVCLCRQVTDRCVVAAIEAGARDRESLVRTCRAGTGCGGCLATVEAMLRAAVAACGDSDQPRMAAQHA
jgi:bacterioferritin-associated ferredoxin